MLSMADGWLVASSDFPQGLISYETSPNFESRPLEAVVSLLVIHDISLPPGQFGGRYVHDLFLNRLDCNADDYFEQLENLRVSAHFFIDRAGSVCQFVSCDNRAWHAGRSSFQGRENCNDFSIGIELEGTDETPFSEGQYQMLAQLTRTLMSHYPITAVVGHADIAPGRKTDPGHCFDWQAYQSLSLLPSESLPFQSFKA